MQPADLATTKTEDDNNTEDGDSSTTASGKEKAAGTSENTTQKPTVVKKRRRRKNKKPKGMPTRPLSAYNVFFKEERLKWLEEYKKKGEDGSDGPRDKSSTFRQMGKDIGQRWKSLTQQERAPFVKVADTDMVRYRKQIEEYNERQIKDSELARSSLERVGDNSNTASVMHHPPAHAPSAAANALLGSGALSTAAFSAPTIRELLHNQQQFVGGVPSLTGGGGLTNPLQAALLRQQQQQQLQFHQQQLAGMPGSSADASDHAAILELSNRLSLPPDQVINWLHQKRQERTAPQLFQPQLQQQQLQLQQQVQQHQLHQHQLQQHQLQQHQLQQHQLQQHQLQQHQLQQHQQSDQLFAHQQSLHAALQPAPAPSTATQQLLQQIMLETQQQQEAVDAQHHPPAPGAQPPG